MDKSIGLYISKFECLARMAGYTQGSKETFNMFTRGLPEYILCDVLKPPTPNNYADLKKRAMSWHKAETWWMPYSDPNKHTKARTRWSTDRNEPSSVTKETDSGKDSPLHDNLINLTPPTLPEATTTSQCQWTSDDRGPQTKEIGDDKADKGGDRRVRTPSEEEDRNKHIKEGLLKLMADLKGNDRRPPSLETASVVATRATSPETAL
jgi:hypothetical protein